MKFDTYDNLIAFAKGQQVQRFSDFKDNNAYFEGHHILPKHLGGGGLSKSRGTNPFKHLSNVGNS
jgi:hypothetical protein